jgi:hypothetical protein
MQQQLLLSFSLNGANLDSLTTTFRLKYFLSEGAILNFSLDFDQIFSQYNFIPKEAEQKALQIILVLYIMLTDIYFTSAGAR